MQAPLVFRCAKCGAFNRLAAMRPGQAQCGKCKADLETGGHPVEVDGPALGRSIASSPAPVLVDFWAPWCGPCRSFAPVLKAYAQETAGRLIVLKLDTEANPEAGQRYGIQSIPTLALFRGGKELERVSGALPLHELRRFVDAASASRPG